MIPKKHFVNIWDIDSDVLTKITIVTKRVAHRMQEVMHAEGVNTFSANGKPAGQDIYHFHMHVIPLAKGERTKFCGVVAVARQKRRKVRARRSGREAPISLVVLAERKG